VIKPRFFYFLLANKLINRARGRSKNKNMEEVQKCPCPHCEKRAVEEQQQEEFNFAVLVSLVPLLVFTLFGQMGLF
jgi:hypothetical protein